VSDAVSAVLIAALLAGCVLDRTGQSASEVFRRDLVLHATRLNNLENQFDRVESRVAQLEELNRSRGQNEILKMETIEEVRSEVARLRGEIEVINHTYGGSLTDLSALGEDASFRLAWLEDRAAQIEDNLGISPPPPPELAPAAVTPGDSQLPLGTLTDGPPTVVTPGDRPQASIEPDDLIKRAEDHLAAGREKAAVAALTRFMELYPDHPKVPRVLYRRAEAAFNGADYSAAVLYFQEVIDGHKDSQWASWSMLRQGECFDSQNQPENARLFYEDVVRIWPGSEAAREARQKLKK
jgi:TolA-binding protein